MFSSYLVETPLFRDADAPNRNPMWLVA